MHKKVIFPVFSAVLLSFSSSLADTITLKSGKVLQGRVLEERGDDYVLEVFLTKTIKDRKIVKKSEVESIEVEAPDTQPFEELKLTEMLPTPDLMEEEHYQVLIEKKLKPFVEKFPKSKHLSEVKKVLSALESELSKIQAGELKLSGEWIKPSEWNANAYDLDASIAFKEMQEAAIVNNYRKALMTYDQLLEDFPGSGAEGDAKALAEKVITKYLAIVSRKADTAKERLQKREASLRNIPAQNRRAIQAAWDAERARYERAIAKAKADRNRWLPAYDYDGRSLTSLERALNSELRKLTRTSSRKPDDRGEDYRQLWIAAGNGDKETVARGLSKFKSKKVNPKYATLLSDHLAANPAPDPIAEEKKKSQPVVEEKKELEEASTEKKEQIEEIKREPILAPEAPEEEEGGGMIGIVYALLGIAIIGLLVGFFLKSRKSQGEE